jgi:hypothetical protein
MKGKGHRRAMVGSVTPTFRHDPGRLLQQVVARRTGPSCTRLGLLALALAAPAAGGLFGNGPGSCTKRLVRLGAHRCAEGADFLA